MSLQHICFFFARSLVVGKKPVSILFIFFYFCHFMQKYDCVRGTCFLETKKTVRLGFLGWNMGTVVRFGIPLRRIVGFAPSMTEQNWHKAWWIWCERTLKEHTGDQAVSFRFCRFVALRVHWFSVPFATVHISSVHRFAAAFFFFGIFLLFKEIRLLVPAPLIGQSIRASIQRLRYKDTGCLLVRHWRPDRKGMSVLSR